MREMCSFFITWAVSVIVSICKQTFCVCNSESIIVALTAGNAWKSYCSLVAILHHFWRLSSFFLPHYHLFSTLDYIFFLLYYILLFVDKLRDMPHWGIVCKSFGKWNGASYFVEIKTYVSIVFVWNYVVKLKPFKFWNCFGIS